jgi:hypothetical protein
MDRLRNITITQATIALALIIQLAYAGGVIAFSIWGNGYLFSVESPAPVTWVTDTTLVVELAYQSRLTMNATCSCDLICENSPSVELSRNSYNIRKGLGTRLIEYTIPPGANGPCHIEGTFYYSPPQVWGLHMSHTWKSDNFTP